MKPEARRRGDSLGDFGGRKKATNLDDEMDLTGFDEVEEQEAPTVPPLPTPQVL